MANILLEMRNITKTFPAVKALDNVNLQVEEGEIHAIVGENGAGKSTLMKVLSGIHPYGSYEGQIFYNGEECHFTNTKDSERKGIVIIHQELALVPYMTIGENMFLGNERGSSLKINWNETYAKGNEYLRVVGLSESSRTLVKDIGVGKQQLVEIAKALAKKAKLLILDEPTSSLNETESKHLLDLMLKFKEQGVGNVKDSEFIKRINSLGLYVKIKFKIHDNILYITTRNNSVISREEIDRIDKKLNLSEYKTPEEIFMNSIDQTEGAGLGIIMIKKIMKQVSPIEDCFSIRATDTETVTELKIMA